MPDPPPPAKGSAFEIDERKFRSAMPPPASSAGEDFKMVAMVLGTAIFVVAWLIFTVWSLFTAPPLAGVSAIVVLLIAWLLASRR